MRAGILNEIIKIYGHIAARDEYGSLQQGDYLKTTTRANVAWNNGTRSFPNDELFYGLTKTFTVRSYVDVANTDTIEWQNMKFRIISIEDRREYNGKIILAELINE